MRRQGSHIFYRFGSQIAVRFSASRAGHPLPWYSFLLEIESTHGNNARIRSTEKNSITSSGFEPAALRLVAKCLNQLRYRVPPPHLRVWFGNILLEKLNIL
jgi:hypothetical protein